MTSARGIRTLLRRVRRAVHAGVPHRRDRRAHGGVRGGEGGPRVPGGVRAPAAARTRAGPSSDHRGAAVRRARRRGARLPQARGPQPHRLAQDQQRARPGAAHPAPRQDARDRRDRRGPARRRHRHRGRPLRLRVHDLHGRGRHRAPGAQRRAHAAARRRGHPGQDRLAHAQGRDQRRLPRLGRERRDDQLHLRHGGGPASVPRDGARLPEGHRRRGARAAARRDRHGFRMPSSPASAAAPTRSACSTRSSTTTASSSTASRPPATASTPRATRHPSSAAAPACCTARRPSSCRTRTARPSSPTRSRRASTTRASGPSTPGSPRSGAPSTSPRPTTRRCRRCACCPRPRASSRRSSRRTPSPARCGSAASSAPMRSSRSASPGRGDKDMDTAARYFDLYDERAEPRSPIGRLTADEAAKGEGIEL